MTKHTQIETCSEDLMANAIKTTTGPLGQGICTAVGMALAERMHNARFGTDLARKLIT